MTNAYSILKKKHQQEVNEFPMIFAFNNAQLEEGMKKLGLTMDDGDKMCCIRGLGFIRKTDEEALHEMFDRHDKEMKEAIKFDTTGDGFVFDMFAFELANHEYGYTGEIDDTLNALGLTLDEVRENKNLLHGLNRARKACN